MPDINISFQEVKNMTRDIRTHNDTLTSTLADIQKEIRALESSWTSDTSVTIRDKITGMQPKFDSYRDVIESYAKFLDRTVADYESTESTLNTNASSQFI